MLLSRERHKVCEKFDMQLFLLILLEIISFEHFNIFSVLKIHKKVLWSVKNVKLLTCMNVSDFKTWKFSSRLSFIFSKACMHASESWEGTSRKVAISIKIRKSWCIMLRKYGSIAGICFWGTIGYIPYYRVSSELDFLVDIRRFSRHKQTVETFLDNKLLI